MPTLRITGKDALRILDAVVQLQDCDQVAELPSAMRRAVGSLIRGEIVAYSEFDLSGLASDSAGPPDLDAVARLVETSPFVSTDDAHISREINSVVPWMVQFAEQHPLFMLALREPDPPVAKISEFLSLPRFQDLALYQQFFRPLSVTRQIAVCPTLCSGLVTGLTVNRSGRDFTERDRNCLTLLTPHLREAFRTTVLQSQLRDHLARHQATLQSIPSAIVMLTKDGRRMQFETAMARRILLQCFPGHDGRRPLPEPLQRWLATLLQQRKTLDQPCAAESTLRLSTSAGFLTARYVPAHEGVYLLLQFQDGANAARRLMELGLTRREAEVLESMRDGSTNRQIARRLHISPGTVRTHVERILSKLAVGTRTAAVHRAEEHLRQVSGD